MGSDERGGHDGLSTVGVNTVDATDSGADGQGAIPVATILSHPDPRRIGERATLAHLKSGLPVAISRNQPPFVSALSGPAQPLDDPRISRRPVWLQLEDRRLRVSAEERVRVEVDGAPLGAGLTVSEDQLTGGGAVISLGGCAVLWLHMASGPPPSVSWNGLLGVSEAMGHLRDRIARVAAAPFPVLLRGASGVGKELVARAIHQASPRASGPWIALNMAAVPGTVAASELFGHERGAFTGAVQAGRGRFELADGGTLFLDEIGETPAEIQTQLLRVLDSGEIQPVGRSTRRVDVRVIAATDADLERLLEERRFSQALLYRLQTSLIEVPPLRARRVDIPILLHHFLREGLATVGAADRLLPPPPSERPWLGARLIHELMAHPFPGNVRELKNTAIEIALHSHDRRSACLPPAVEARLGAQLSPDPGPSPQVGAAPGRGAASGRAGSSSTSGRRPALTEAEVAQVLASNDWKLAPTAAQLGVARNTLVRFMETIPGLRRPVDLEGDAILAALARWDGDVDQAAADLKVSAHGLRLRINALSLSPDDGEGPGSPP